MMKKLMLLLLITTLVAPQIFGETNTTTNNTITLHLFFGNGCPHCGQELSFLEKILPKYPSLDIIEHEVYSSKENQKLFLNMAKAFDFEIQGVPTVFIDDKVISGFNSRIGHELEEQIKKCLIEDCGDPITKTKSEHTIKVVGDSSPVEDPSKTKIKEKLTIPAVISAAAVDAINPCAFAVLILLTTTILVSGRKKQALLAGLAFTLSIYISYFLMGLGLYSAIQAAGLTRTFYIIVAVLAIFIGLFNLKDYFWYGKWFVMEVPLSWRPKMKGIIRGVTSVPGAFLIGFVVSLFLLPCTSGPYIVILGFLAEATSRNYALFLLALYNFIFIIPMLAITFAIYFGVTTTARAERWRTKKLKVLHLIAGLIILLLGIGMLIAILGGFI